MIASHARGIPSPSVALIWKTTKALLGERPLNVPKPSDTVTWVATLRTSNNPLKFLGTGVGVEKPRVNRMSLVYAPVAVEYLLPVYVYRQAGWADASSVRS